VQFWQHALFSKVTPTDYRVHHNFNCYINERETPKTCLTNHKGSISHHITLLVINSLGGGHTNTQIHTHTHITDKSNFKKPSACFDRCMPGLKITSYTISSQLFLYTVYGKTFEGENFHRFCNANVLPLKISIISVLSSHYTKMVPPCLISKECAMFHGT